MKNSIYFVASTDSNYDVIGVYETSSDVGYEGFQKTHHHAHSLFEECNKAIREAKRLSIGKGGNGAFFVGKIEDDMEYLVFRCGSNSDDEEELMDYLTTRDAVDCVLEANQDNGVLWKTVDDVIEEYKTDKTIGDKLFKWLSEKDILATRDYDGVKRLKFYTKDTRNTAIAY